MTDQQEKMRRTAAADMQSNFEQILTEHPLKTDTVRRATALFFVDEDYIKVWNKKISEWESENITTMSPKQRRVFMDHLNVQYSKLITEKLDPLTRVFVRSYNADRKGISWHFPQCLLWNFDFKKASQGVYGCIDGVPRSGKTSFACTLIPMFHKIGIDVITNIKIDDAPDYIHIAKRLSEVVLLMDRLDRWVLILDETATFVDKKLALSTANIDFENLARFIGKMGGRLLMVTHSFEKDIPTRLQEWMTERFSKLEKDKARVMLVGEKFKFFDVVKHIPDSELHFVTEDITSLNFDISIKKLLEMVQDGTPVTKALDSLLARPRKEKDKKTQIIELYNSGKHTKKEIAEIIGVTQSYVTQVT